MVQRRFAVPETANPVTSDVGEDGVVMVAVPETTVQVPVPTVGLLPAKVAMVASHAVMSEPALATVGVQPIQPNATHSVVFHASKHWVVVL